MTIEQLYQRNNYLEIIEQFSDSSNAKDIYYVILSYIGINKIEVALNMIISHQSELLKEFPKEIISLHIDLLIENNRFDEAEKALNTYKELPYISYEIEELFKDLDTMIQRCKYSITKNKKENYHTELLSDNVNNQTEAVIALYNEDIKEYIRDFKVLLDDENCSPLVQSLILLLLLSKKNDEQFRVRKLGLVYDIVPYELEPIVDKETINKKISEVVTINSITLNKTIEFILMRYSLSIYPERLFDGDDTSIVLAASLLAARATNEYSEEIYQIITKNQLNKEKIETMSSIIDEIINK